MARFKVKQLRLKIAEAVSNRLRLKATSNRLLAVAVLVQRAVGKFLNLSDTATVADIIAAILGKSVEDQVSSTDVASLDVGANPEDVAAIAESASLGVVKPRSDAAAITDVFSNSLGKVFTDSGVTSDAQAITFGKQPVETISALELIALDASKSFAEDPAVADLAAVAFTKNLADSVSLTDDAQAQPLIDQPLSDSGSMSDLANVTFGKRPQEIVGTVDIQAFAFSKGLNDTVYVTDDIGAEATIDDDQTLQVQKRLIELPSITDLVTRVAEYARSFSDTGSAADTVVLEAAYQRAFDESPSVGDSASITAVYSRVFADSASMTDSVTSLVAKGVSDILGGSDSGVLLNQDYVDNNLYFADDYVGLKRIF